MRVEAGAADARRGHGAARADDDAAGAADREQRLLPAVDDGAARGKITAATQSSLVSQIRSAIKGNSAHAKLPGIISTIQQQSGKTINADYAALLLGWANDLYARV